MTDDDLQVLKNSFTEASDRTATRASETPQSGREGFWRRLARDVLGWKYEEVCGDVNPQ